MHASPAKPAQPIPRRRLVGLAAIGFAVVALTFGLVVKHRLPSTLVADLRAGLAARDVQDPHDRLRRYLEVRYGSFDIPANRQAAFLDFFNVDHIKALQLMVKHSPADQREANIRAMAEWVASYRNSLTPGEKTELRAHFATAEGEARLRQARARYNSQDVYYRGQTAGVISELLNTIHAIQQP